MFNFLAKFLIIPFLSSSILAQTIRDEAHFFSTDAIKDSQSKITRIEKKFNTSDLIIIETFSSPTTGSNLKSFFRARFPKGKNFSGLYILLIKKPKKILIGSSKKMKSLISKAVLDKGRSLFIESFKARKFDQGLKNSIDYLLNEISVARLNTQKTKTHLTTSSHSKIPSKGFSLSSIIFWAFIILALIFLFNKFRSQQRTGSPFPSRNLNPNSQGYNNNDQQNQRQGGGSGIFGSILGGIGGAIAGNWIYDKFFGSNTSAASHPTANETAHPPESESVEHQMSATEPEIADMSGDFSSGDDWGGDFGDSGGDDW